MMNYTAEQKNVMTLQAQAIWNENKGAWDVVMTTFDVFKNVSFIKRITKQAKENTIYWNNYKCFSCNRIFYFYYPFFCFKSFYNHIGRIGRTIRIG